MHLLSTSRRRRAAPTVFDRLVLYRSLAVASASYGAVSSSEKCILKKEYPSKHLQSGRVLRKVLGVELANTGRPKTTTN